MAPSCPAPAGHPPRSARAPHPQHRPCAALEGHSSHAALLHPCSAHRLWPKLQPVRLVCVCAGVGMHTLEQANILKIRIFHAHKMMFWLSWKQRTRPFSPAQQNRQGSGLRPQAQALPWRRAGPVQAPSLKICTAACVSRSSTPPAGWRNTQPPPPASASLSPPSCVAPCKAVSPGIPAAHSDGDRRRLGHLDAGWKHQGLRDASEAVAAEHPSWFTPEEHTVPRDGGPFQTQGGP